MLEDAVLANSPMSLSILSASALLMPYCFASSETRVLATVLLLARTRFPGISDRWWVVQNELAHREVLIECS